MIFRRLLVVFGAGTYSSCPLTTRECLCIGLQTHLREYYCPLRGAIDSPFYSLSAKNGSVGFLLLYFLVLIVGLVEVVIHLLHRFLTDSW